MNRKTGLTLFVLLITAVMASAFVSAAQVPLTIEYVEINGDKYYSDNVAIADRLERGEDIDITVKVVADQGVDVDDVQIEAYISGYRYSHYERSLVSDVTKTFDLENGSSDKYGLSLQVPLKMDFKDTKLRVRVSNEDDDSFEQVYQLRIRGVDESRAIQIRDFTVSPSDVVEAGRPLSFKVNVKNYGNDDLDDVSVRVSIPELGIADYETLDAIEADESETFEELLLRIPKCAEPGTYTVDAVVSFDEYEESTASMVVTVLEGGVCEVVTPKPPKSKTVVTVPESQEVVMGTTGGVYPIMISNMGGTAKTYTLTASGVSAWGTVRFDPAAVVVVQPESVKTVYMYVAAKVDAQEGAQVFKLVVESEDDSKQVVLTANVIPGQEDASYDGLRRGLEIGLIVLVVILIILGLIIGFNKIRGDREDEESQTYY